MLGRRIGRFVIERTLGAGGMGAVYAARDEVLDRLVALKVLPSAHEGDPERRTRLLREARSAAALSHANVATVYEAGEGEGIVFLAMELVTGESLSSRLSRGALSLESLIDVGEGIARGLACAHAAGVVHRDLKPANVMLTDDGTPKLVDFGLARAPDRAAPNVARESFTGTVVGTPGYMAPEQLRGDAIDARTDLFALGVVLHELWAGRPPFGDSGLTAMALTLYEEPPALDAERAGAPPALIELVAQLLQKDAAARPSSSGEIVRRLAGLRVQAAAAPDPVERAVAQRRDREAIASTIEVVRASRRPPESMTTLLGREEDLASIERVLASGARLLTITGSPGIGKSVVASELCERLRSRGERVTSVALGPEARIDELEAALLLALRGQSATAKLTDLIALEEGVVHLDGGEACAAELAQRLRGWLGTSRARFVTSRRNVLGLDEEHVVTLGPLVALASRELFLARARRVRPIDTTNAEELAAIDTIVALLDGSPLAIGLAASRVALLSPTEIVSRLRTSDDARLALLTDRKATGSASSLREAIAWSFALLTRDDARVLARLSLFEGSFATEQAERLASLPGESLPVLDAIEASRAASLVRAISDREGRVRLVIEPNVRAYARSVLRDDPRAAAVEETFVHAHGVLARDGVLAPARGARSVVEEAGSLRAALRLARGQAASTIPALWIATLLLGHVADLEIERELEALLVDRARQGSLPLDLLVHAELALLQRLLDRDIERGVSRVGPIMARAEMLGDAELLAAARSASFDALVRVSRYDEADTLARALLDAARAAGHAAQEIDALEKQSILAWRRSRPEDSLLPLRRALGLAESLHDRRRQASVLMSLGILCVQSRRLPEGRALYERSRELARAEHLPRFVALLENNLGVVHHEEDRLDDALASFQAASIEAPRAGMGMLTGVAYGNLGMVHHEAGRATEAGVALDTGIRLLTALGDGRFRAVFHGARAALLAEQGALDEARADLASAGELLSRAFEPQLALALSIRSAHVELIDAARRGDAELLARATATADAHLAELATPESITARSDLARMAARALARARR